jgi:hypothetical protein
MGALYFFLAVISFFGLIILVSIVKSTIKLKPVKEVFNSLGVDDKNNVYRLISSYSQQPQNSCFLVQIDYSDNANNIISIPNDIDSIWGGRSYQIIFNEQPKNPEIEVQEIPFQSNFSFLGKKKYLPILVPRIKMKNGKMQNTWSSKNLLSRNPKLKSYINSLIKEQQVDLLTSIICDRPILNNHYEPIFQVRIGSGISWIQGPQYPKCNTCKKKMNFIFNLPGDISGKKGYGEFVYYIFSCSKHPDNLEFELQAF